MKRSKQDAEQTKQQLIDAACKVFYREGVAHATLEQIAREAGVTRGALYWHFDNKTAILDALFQNIMPSMQEFQQCLQPLGRDDYWQYVVQYYTDFFGLIREDERLRKFCTLMHLKCELTESNAQIVALLYRYRCMWEEHIIEMVAKAVEVGALPYATDIRNTALLLRSFLSGIMVTYLGDIEHKGSTSAASSPIPPLQHMLSVLKDHPFLKVSPS